MDKSKRAKGRQWPVASGGRAAMSIGSGYRFSVSAPVYRIPVENEGLLSGYVEVKVPKEETITEAIRCSGMPCSTVDETVEDAACRTVARLRDKFGFEVKDSNLEKKKFFENLCERVSTDYSSLRGKYKRFKCDYNLLKGYYSSFLAEKEQHLSDRREFKENLVKCLSLVKRPKTAVVRPCSSEGVKTNVQMLRDFPPSSLFFPLILTLIFFFLHAVVFDFVRVCTSVALKVFIMAVVVVQICFRDFLRIVCQHSVSAPVYGITVENEGLLSVYVEVEVPKGETVAEAIRCWGMPCSTVDEIEEDAACCAVARLRDEFGFEVKDSNLEPK
uniref:Uncharacterized protein n=1 Tax=Ananas comosus var. bracteatus TaxID=296719 RepID=A0A6V7Q215_ANACO|nr:unnamed protein product [Ananas comosus var. bracteatus]